MILTDSNNQVVVALNSYANSGKMVQINPEKIADSGKLLLSRELSNFGLTLYGLYDMSSISKEFQTSRIQSFFWQLPAFYLHLAVYILWQEILADG